MRGFGGRIQTLLRASVQHRVLPAVLHDVLSMEPVIGRVSEQALREELHCLDSAMFSFRGLRCSSLLLESVNVEVASFGESITGERLSNSDPA